MFRIFLLSFFSLLFLTNCRTKKSNPIKKPPSIEELSISYKGKASFKLLGKLTGRSSTAHAEYILVKNIHPNPDSARLQERIYFEENNSICSMEEKVKYFTMNFFRSTDCTDYFINHKAVYSGFNRKIIDEDCSQDAEGFFFYERSKENPNSWISDIDEKRSRRAYNDTIICNKP